MNKPDDSTRVNRANERVRLSILGDTATELPERVGEWFRDVLREAEVRELTDPLWQIAPSAPTLVFRDADRRYELHFRTLIETRNGRRLRSYNHDSIREMAERLHRILLDTHASKGELQNKFFEYLTKEAQ